MLLTLWSGLVLGSIYALVAYGFTLSMLPSGIFNFAQGAIVVSGTYLTYWFLALSHLDLIAVLTLDILAGTVLGAVCELACLRPLRRGGQAWSQHNELVTTVGLSTAIVGAIAVTWGYQPRVVPFDGPTTPVHFLGINAQPVQIFVLVGAVVAAAGLHLSVHRTRWGRVCLAVAEDRDAATLRGINVNALSLAGFAMAGAFGTVIAVIIGPITYAIPTLANTFALGGFAAIALGGRGRFLGSLVGGLLVGLASSLATRYIGANYASLAVLAVLLATLSVRPKGLNATAVIRDI